MSRRLVNLTLDNLDDLSRAVPSLRVLGTRSGRPANARCADGDAELEKEAWVSDTLLEWGSCGQLVYVDGGRRPGYVLYAPPAYVPRSVAFPTSPVSADAVLLMTARLEPEFRGGGLGRMLVQGVARDVVPARDPGDRGVRPRRRPSAGRREPTAACCRPTTCSRSASRPCGRTRAPPAAPGHPQTTVSWREDVEYALERLLGSMQAPVARPRLTGCSGGQCATAGMRMTPVGGSSASAGTAAGRRRAGPRRRCRGTRVEQPRAVDRRGEVAELDPDRGHPGQPQQRPGLGVDAAVGRPVRATSSRWTRSASRSPIVDADSPAP